MGIYSIKKMAAAKAKGKESSGMGIRASYLRVVGIQVDTEGSGTDKHNDISVIGAVVAYESKTKDSC